MVQTLGLDDYQDLTLYHPTFMTTPLLFVTVSLNRIHTFRAMCVYHADMKLDHL